MSQWGAVWVAVALVSCAGALSSQDEESLQDIMTSAVRREKRHGMKALPDGSWVEEQLPTIPQLVHLSLGPQHHQMVVMWASEGEAEDVPPSVLYGTSPDNLNLVKNGTMDWLTYGNPKGLQNYYRVILENLEPETHYYYKVKGNDDIRGPFDFVTSPFHENWSPEFVVLGDMGRTGGALSLRRLKHEAGKRGRYAAFIHVGDFAYDLHSNGGIIGDEFMERIEPIASKVPYMTCPGNHERNFDFNHYRMRFSMPVVFHQWPAGQFQLWYTYSIGPVRFISYSTEVYFFAKDYILMQEEWLEQELKYANGAGNRTAQPWVIVYGHRPMYCSNVDNDDCTKGGDSIVRQRLEGLFFRYGVDLVLEGHEHSYERLYPVYNGTVPACHYRGPRAPVHIISGSAGCNEHEGLCADVILKPQGPWSAARHWLPGLNGYGRIKVHNVTHLTWQQVASMTGRVIDSFTLEQQHHGPFAPLDMQHVMEGCTAAGGGGS